MLWARRYVLMDARPAGVVRGPRSRETRRLDGRPHARARGDGGDPREAVLPGGDVEREPSRRAPAHDGAGSRASLRRRGPARARDRRRADATLRIVVRPPARARTLRGPPRWLDRLAAAA